MTLSAFIDRLRRDQDLRDRFAQDPREVLHEFDVALSPHYYVPERLTPTQLERLLADWSAPTGDDDSQRRFQPPHDATPVVIYGPPPGPVTPRWLSRLRRLFGRH
jgi:hypothetical protein